MVSKWHHIDDPVRPKDLLKHLKVKDQRVITSLDFNSLNLDIGNLKYNIYKDLIIFLAGKYDNTGDVARILGVPRRTLVHQLRKIFKDPDGPANL